MDPMNQKNWVDRCEEIVMIILMALMADCAIFGAGRTIEFGPIGFRMMLVAVLMVITIPVMVRNFKVLLRSKILWILVAFAFWLMYQGYRGICNGNDMRILIADLKGFSYFVVFVPVLCLVNSKSRVYALMKALMYASGFLAVTALFLTCLFKWNYELFMKLYSIDPEGNILNLSVIIERKVPRLFFRSTNYFLIGCAFAIYFSVVERARDWKYPAMAGACLFALLVSYTRATYLAAAIAATALVVMVAAFGTKAHRAELWKNVAATALAFLVITGGLSLLMGNNYIKHGLTRISATFGTAGSAPAAAVIPEAPAVMQTANTVQTDGQIVKLSAVSYVVPLASEDVSYAENMTTKSDEVREMTTRELRSYIRTAPVLGHGLGKAITCREDGHTEYFYHELMVKTGVIGLVLYLLPVLLVLVDLIRKHALNKACKLALSPWLAVLLGFLGYTFYNPYMNASLGILFYCCVIGIFSNMTYQQKYEKK